MKSTLISRREFINRTAKYFAAAGGAGLIFSNSYARAVFLDDSLQFYNDLLKQGIDPGIAIRARYWLSTAMKDAECSSCHAVEKIKGLKSFNHKETVIKCLLCAQGCVIKNNERGKCRARINVNGELRSLVYGHPVAVHIDPIEKKPFYHFLPGSEAYSLATAGCPLSCKFCQNWEISQAKPEDYSVPFTPPAAVAASASSNKAPLIAFTYNEPTVFFEYLIDIAKLAKKEGIRSVLVSCGFMNADPLKELCETLDAIKIDLKGFSEDFYRRVCGAELKPVLNTIKQISRSNIHLEIVNLVVPTLNDSDEMIKGLCKWIFNEAGPDVPVHFTRFHPDYKLLNLSPTPISTLERARETAMAQGIRYAFVGNVPGHPGNNTYCPGCGKAVIKRTGFFLIENNLNNGRCGYCGFRISGVWL